MFSLNRATIIGNLTRDPELRYTPNGQAVASFAVATNRRWTNANGQPQDDTQYHEVVAWGKLGEIAQQMFTKGKKIYVEGRLQTRSWEAPDGSKRNRTEIIAENLIALSPKGNSGSLDEGFPSTSPEEGFTNKAKSKSGSIPGSSKNSSVSGSESQMEDDGEIELEDIPF
jgi:single-strand DNA-binding protein